MLWILVLFCALLYLPWYFLPAAVSPSDKINASIGIATAFAVIGALFSHWFESFLYPPLFTLEFNDGLIDEFDKQFWIRGKILNRGKKTANQCRIRITNIQTEMGIQQQSNVSNGYLQWQGGFKGTTNLNRGEHLIFDIGTRASKAENRPLKLLAYIGDTLVEEPLSVGKYVLTIKVFGDNFNPHSCQACIKIGATANDNHIEKLAPSFFKIHI